MNVTVEAQGLAAALKNNLAERRSTLNIFEHVLVEATDRQIRVVSCDGARELEAVVAADSVRQPGAITVHAGKLAASLYGLAGAVDLASGQNDIATLSQGRRSFRLPSLSAGQFPDAPEMTAAQSVAIDPVALGAAIARVEYAAARRDVRYYLNGVHINGRDVVATDGHRVACVTLEAGDMPAMTINRDSLRSLMAALHQADARITASESALEVSYSGGRFRTVLVDGRYPDYRPVITIPSAPAATVSLDPACLAAPLERMKGFVLEELTPVWFAIDGGCLTLRCGDNANDDVPAGLADGQWDEVGLAHPYIRDVVSQIGRPFTWTNPGSREKQFFTTDDGSTVDVVMPVAR